MTAAIAGVLGRRSDLQVREVSRRKFCRRLTVLHLLHSCAGRQHSAIHIRAVDLKGIVAV